jgi:hypothetical protein
MTRAAREDFVSLERIVAAAPPDERPTARSIPEEARLAISVTEANRPVRERPEHHGGHSSASPDVSRLAHPRQSFPVVLNANWRVVDHPLQWVLQQRKGNQRGKNTGWRGRLFFRTRSGLLGLLTEYCGQVAAQSRATLEALPERHR